MTEVGCQATNKFRRHPCPQLLRAAKILLEARARASLVPPFMVPRRVQNRRSRLSMNLPFVPPPRSRSALQVSRTSTRTIGFMVPMPDSEIVQAFHEPSRLRVADPRSGPRLCEAQRFMVPMRAQKRKEATHEPRSSRRKDAHFSNAECGVRNAEFGQSPYVGCYGRRQPALSMRRTT